MSRQASAPAANSPKEHTTTQQRPAATMPSQEVTARAALERKLASRVQPTAGIAQASVLAGRSDSGAGLPLQPRSESPTAEHPRRRAREPQASKRQPANAAPHDAGTSNRTSYRTSGRMAATRRDSWPASSHKSQSPIWCGNNILSPKLKRNGGHIEKIGSPSQCFRRGFGAGFHREIAPEDLEEFLADFVGPYKKLIDQPLFYGDGPVPPGKIRATLSQCMQRGYGVGSMQRAKKILKERK